MALEQGIYTREEMDAILYAGMEEQFGAYWMRQASPESQAWYRMLLCWQFRPLRPLLRRWESNPLSHAAALARCARLAGLLGRVRYGWKKGRVVLKRLGMG